MESLNKTRMEMKTRNSTYTVREVNMKLVKLTNPVNEAEAAAVYLLLEDRGDRCLIELIGCDELAPVECVAKTEIKEAR